MSFGFAFPLIGATNTRIVEFWERQAIGETVMGF